jgi:hypothetical protein
MTTLTGGQRYKLRAELQGLKELGKSIRKMRAPYDAMLAEVDVLISQTLERYGVGTVAGAEALLEGKQGEDGKC